MVEPGTQSGYHALTQGYIEGEIVRRVTGRTIGSYLRRRSPSRSAPTWIGLPASEDDRAADLVPPPETALDNVASDAESIAVRTLTSVPITALEPRTRSGGRRPPAAELERPIGRTSALRPGVRR